tara:strand:+ start:1783 stop:2406 length:624 start_codon:yes stop_codon:yes gene_type:complete
MRNFISEIIESELKEIIILKESFDSEISSDLNYHVNNNLSVHNSIYRYASDKHLELIKEVRSLYNKNNIVLCENDEHIIESDAGLFGEYRGEQVLLDLPFEKQYDEINEAKYKGKKVKLNQPKRGGSKKFYVFVKDPKTNNVIRVEFGAKDGGRKLSVKLKDPDARKRFSDRHNCEEKNDKTKPGYWSCRLPRYAKMLGLSGEGRWW